MRNLYMDSYKTSDITVVAVLLYLEHPIKSIDQKNPTRIFFLFEKNRNLTEDIQKYWNNELLVNPLKFSQCLKLLKGRIYND